MAEENIKIAVRVRPFMRHLPHESDPELESCVKMEENNVLVFDPQHEDAAPKQFSFNYAFWSHRDQDPHYVDQEGVFQTLGMDVLEAAWEGYNSTLFAYGQSGSGKTYSMTGGKGEHRGMIPRVSEHIIGRCVQQKSEGKLKNFSLAVSVTQIYLEKITDLLAVGKKFGVPLKCGEIDKLTGWGVIGANRVPVQSYDDIEAQLNEAETKRVTKSTGLNDTSSRGHTIMTLFFSREPSDSEIKVRSKINLVDLAGSERLGKTKNTDQKRIDEGLAINQSLTTLGRVIAALGDGSRPPYRDSSLTMVLRESLSSNSKTVMIAALNPFPGNYEETMSTLRFAQNVSLVKVKVRLNVQSVAQQKRTAQQAQSKIDELTMELERLRRAPAMDESTLAEFNRMKEELESNKRTVDLSEMEEGNVAEVAAYFKKQRDAYNKHLGVTPISEMDPSDCRLYNLSPDYSLDRKVTYRLAPGKPVTIGRLVEEEEGEEGPTIQANCLLSGPNIAMMHVELENTGRECFVSPCYIGTPEESKFETSVNGQLIKDRTKLEQGARLWIGRSHCFVFEDPNQGSPSRQVDYQMAFAELLARDGFKDPRQAEEEMQRAKAEVMEKMRKKMAEEQSRQEAELEEARKKIEEEHARAMRIAEGTEVGRLEEERLEHLRQLEEERQRVRELMTKKAKEEAKLHEKKMKERIQKLNVENEVQEMNQLAKLANQYAEDLKRQVQFQAVLKNRDHSGEGGWDTAEAKIKVTRLWDNTTQLLDASSFRDRYEFMVDVHEAVGAALEHGTPYELSPDRDPFMLPPSRQVFGRADLFVMSLAFGAGTEEDEDEEAEIYSVDRSSEVIGLVKYRIKILAGGFEEWEEEEEEEEEGRPGLMRKGTSSNLLDPKSVSGKQMTFELEIVSVENFHDPHNHEVTMEWRWFGKDAVHESEVVRGPVPDAYPFNFKTQMTVTLTDWLSEKLQEDSIALDFRGRLADVAPPVPPITVNTGEGCLLTSEAGVALRETVKRPVAKAVASRTALSADEEVRAQQFRETEDLNAFLTQEKKRLEEEKTTLSKRVTTLEDEIKKLREENKKLAESGGGGGSCSIM